MKTMNIKFLSKNCKKKIHTKNEKESNNRAIKDQNSIRSAENMSTATYQISTCIKHKKNMQHKNQVSDIKCSSTV